MVMNSLLPSRGPASFSLPPSLFFLIQGRFLSVLKLLRAVPGR